MKLLKEWINVQYLPLFYSVEARSDRYDSSDILFANYSTKIRVDCKRQY
jgi:hypothetical protein